MLICRDPRPRNESVIAIPTGERLEGDLLRAALSKAAALISCLPLVAAALLALMTGTFGLALAAGGQSRRLRWNEMGVWREHCTQPSRSRAAGKFRSAALSMMC